MHRKNHMKKRRLDNLTKVIVALVIILGLLFLYFLISIKYSGLVPLEINSFSSSVGECVDCSMDGSIEIANIQSNDDSIAYWAFDSVTNGGLVDSIGAVSLSGNFVKNHDRLMFNGQESASAECQASCSGSSTLGCGLFDSSEGACKAFDSHAGNCNWKDKCVGTITCENQKKETCSSVPGCSWGGTNCYGSPSVSCSSWNSDKEQCLAADSHNGNCHWESPCSGKISCSSMRNEKECAIIAGCNWVGATSMVGYCEGGSAGCSQWDIDKETCQVYSSKGCSWVGPCQGALECSSQKSASACQAAQGCSLDTKFPVTGSSKWTQSAWIRISNSDIDRTILGMGDAGSISGAYLRIGNGKVYSEAGGDKIESKTDVSDGLWHLINVVYDGKAVKLYVDGALESSKELKLNLQCSGFNVGSGEGASNLIGDIDEVKLYNRDLTSAEIKGMFNLGLFKQKAEFVSRVYDLGQLSAISSVNWDAPSSNGKISITFRTSQNNLTWGDWSREYSSPDSVNLPYARYVQYKAVLTTDDLTETPVLNSLNLNYQFAESALKFVEPSDLGTISKNSIDVSIDAPSEVREVIVNLYNSEGLLKSVRISKPLIGSYSASFSGVSEGTYYLNATSDDDAISDTRKIIVNYNAVEPAPKKIRVAANAIGLDASQKVSIEDKQLKMEPLRADENPIRGLIRVAIESLS